MPRCTVLSVTNSEEQADIRAFVQDLVLSTITQRSTRDVQRLPGPSDLSNPCDLCLARKISLASGAATVMQAPQHFSLKAWAGTAVHEKLEADLPAVYSKAEREITVTIGEVEGLGTIKGHIDLYLPDKATLTDYKTIDMKRLAMYRTSGVSAAHFGQTMLYMLGVRNSGRKADYATLVYIPRDSNKTSDIWVASCSYREDVALGLMDRARRITSQVLSGETTELVPDEGCFVCMVQPYLPR